MPASSDSARRSTSAKKKKTGARIFPAPASARLGLFNPVNSEDNVSSILSLELNSPFFVLSFVCFARRVPTLVCMRQTRYIACALETANSQTRGFNLHANPAGVCPNNPQASGSGGPRSARASPVQNCLQSRKKKLLFMSLFSLLFFF